MFELHDLYEILKSKYSHLKLSQIEEICRSQFAWLSTNMGSDEFKPIKLLKIGKFVPVYYRIELAKKARENKLKCNNGLSDQSEGERKDENSNNKENV